MKFKKFKWNYYILAFLVFIGLMIFIDFKLEGIIAEYFEKRILFNREKIIFCGGQHTRGTFYWPRLRDILVDIAIGGFIVLEIIIYLTVRFSQNKERKILHQSKLVKQEMQIQMNKKNDLITYLAHDLKTPLTSIIGYLTILDESKVPDDVYKDYIKRILEKSYRLEDLTNQFFDITRFNLQEIPLNKALLDAKFFLEQLTEELYPLFSEKNLKIDLNIVPNMKIYVDGSLFARVLNNLLKNTIAYSNKNSVIKINGKIEKDSIELFIENDGDVISEQELKLIFEKFYRRDKSRNQSAGAGLGLAISRQIVEKHGGSIYAKSKNGHTVFIITLPNS